LSIDNRKSAIKKPTRYRVVVLTSSSELPIADCRLRIGLGRNMNLNRQSAIDNRQSWDPPATAWWYWPHLANQSHSGKASLTRYLLRWLLNYVITEN